MPGAGGLTIALAGGAGRGKSTVARALAERLDGQVAGFGDFVRARALDLGLQVDRRHLQGLGQRLVDEDATGFVGDFLRWADPCPGGTLLIDGVRHAEVDAALRAWSSTQGRSYVLVLLAATEFDRAFRLSDGRIATIREIDRHPVERASSGGLRVLADAVIDAHGDPDDVLERVAAVLPIGPRRRP